MKFFVAVTDNQWFDYLRRLAACLADTPTAAGSPEPLDEVNFWQLSPDSQIRTFALGVYRDAFSEEPIP